MKPRATLIGALAPSRVTGVDNIKGEERYQGSCQLIWRLQRHFQHQNQMQINTLHILNLTFKQPVFAQQIHVKKHP
jgi:hypothetical protein